MAVWSQLEIPFKKIALGLSKFQGIERRMETLFKGRDVWVIDDYGHHREEIKPPPAASRKAFPQQRLVTLFQPHRYTRTRDLIGEFKGAFGGADLLFLTEIYSAGEDPIE